MAAGRLLNVLVAVPVKLAVFCAEAVMVIGPIGTPVNPPGNWNWRVVPDPVKSKTRLSGGAVDSGGCRYANVAVTGESRPSPVTVPLMSIVSTSNSAPFAGEMI